MIMKPGLIRRSFLLTKYACYISSFSMAVTTAISPLLFLTFHNLYNISYTFLGFLVLINFVVQLSVDLVFSFFSAKFNIPKTVRLMPFITLIGIIVYSVFPAVFPSAAYAFLLLGTIIFSASSGLGEVLISPIIAALPTDNPDREMSRAHSVYAWGVAVVVLLSTLFLELFKGSLWYLLTLMWGVLPLSAFILFMFSDIPALSSSADTAKHSKSSIRYL